MRIVLAGASGTIGTPLVRRLVAAGHQVVGITRTESNAARLAGAGVRPVVADVLDRDRLLAAVDGLGADAVVHELTALRRPPVRHADMTATNTLRTTGTANLLAVARAVGARRFVVQSMVFGYGYRDHGDRTLTEDDPFGAPEPGAAGRHMAAMRSAEEQVRGATDLAGIALRYGLFYGADPSTRATAGMLRRRRFPVPRSGGGLVNLVLVDDAAAATVAALERGRPGAAYNVVDGAPVRWGDWLDEMAAVLGAPRPPRVPGGLLRVVPYAHRILTTSMRVDNTRAREELGWRPAAPDHRAGLRGLAGALS
ncbi:NAD-dependent epimerase/dehydratase family protein [Micromonospora siamensis]|uniref:Nucleoside-diphosphate-sugar epimerase n=1 Tax=Micromonospora siamensis TaxID=299152 RepID=A0A1C5HM95_9ACTN|nr:Nucleoside-diphosphate-sugar epimerase [Micromonospora siamensis]